MLYARRLTSDYAQADDLIQEAFLRCQHLPIAAQPERATLAYLYRIIRNLAYDAARRTRFETALFINEEVELDVIDEATAELDELADDERRQQLLMRTLASLPTRTRECLDMYYLQEMKLREIATAQQLSISMVQYLVKAGMQQCAKILDEAEHLTSLNT